MPTFFIYCSALSRNIRRYIKQPLISTSSSPFETRTDALLSEDYSSVGKIKLDAGATPEERRLHRSALCTACLFQIGEIEANERKSKIKNQKSKIKNQKSKIKSNQIKSNQTKSNQIKNSKGKTGSEKAKGVLLYAIKAWLLGPALNYRSIDDRCLGLPQHERSS
ncbi:uncharacterized protein UHOD_11395 [Ustilago sp. UG-2017b]|nr:uncharacterized protein UHOD_11395 [Ustilago sp. UG-2017b]